MLLFGLVLVVLSGGFAGLLVAYNTSGGPGYTVTLFAADIATMNALQIFVAGLAIALGFSLGLWMMGTAIRLRRVRRQAEAAAIERDRLANDLAQRETIRTETSPAADDGRD
jgi:hypothetical protein